MMPSTWVQFMSEPGKYILAYDHHFVAGKHMPDAGPEINMGNRTHEFEAFAEIHGGVRSAIARHPFFKQLVVCPELLDHVFVLVDGKSSGVTSEYQGGKAGFHSIAADFLEIWEEIQLQPASPRRRDGMDSLQHAGDILHVGTWENTLERETISLHVDIMEQTNDEILSHPAPRFVSQDRAVQSSLRESDADSEDDGFWDWRPDWLEGLEARARASEEAQQDQLTYAGGSMLDEIMAGIDYLSASEYFNMLVCASSRMLCPTEMDYEDNGFCYQGGALMDEILCDLPGYFFSFQYLKMLACTSRRMLSAVRDRRHWRNRRVSLNVNEFEDPVTVRWMMEAYMQALQVNVNVRQLAMLHVFPNNPRLEWDARPVIGGPGAFPHMAGFESAHPMMGGAVFDVVLPSNVVGMYIGVRDWCDLRARRQAYCRLDNIFQNNLTVSFSLADLPPQAHPGSRPVSLRPYQSHRFELRWDESFLKLSIDGTGVSLARLRDGAPAAPRPLAKLFVWIYVRPTANMFNELRYRPVPSPVETTATLRCGICNRDFSLLLPRWSVCPMCCTWVCSAHAGQTPWRLCSRCPNQLLDYVGAGSRSEPYLDAEEFFTLSRNTAMYSEDKFRGVVLKVFREHVRFLDANPLALHMIPDPRYRSGMSKRVWERTLYRSRVIIDFLDQGMDWMLFRFLHAEAEHLARGSRNALENLPHPLVFEGSQEEWREIALDHALQLHLDLVAQQKKRAGRTTEIEDTVGGSAPVHLAAPLMTCQTFDDCVLVDDKMTFDAWRRLSLSRAQALCRQQRKRKGQISAPMNNPFHMKWHSSFSPACCPTYTNGSSRIRVPIEACLQLQPPVLRTVPSNFQSLPEADVSCKLLADLHKHPRDDRIRFVADTHVYYVDGVPVDTSVTGLIHRFAETFNADVVISNMMNSRRWPRPEYATLQSNGLLVPMSADEIKQLWSQNGQEAANRGTWMHLQIEVLMNGGAVTGEWPELSLFAEFLQKFPHPLLALRTEWCIFAEDENLAGCIDFVAVCPDNSLVLFDWKRTKQLSTKYDNAWRHMAPPLAHVPDLAGWHYRLQLNTYKCILERHYSCKVSAMYVVCLHPDRSASGPFLDLVPDMSHEVRSILEAQRRARSGKVGPDGRTSSVPAELQRSLSKTNAWEDVSGGAQALSEASQSSFNARIDEDIAMEEERLRAEVSGIAGDSAADAISQGSECREPSECLALQLPAVNMPIEALESAKRRRLQPGASSTGQAFDDLFRDTTAAWQRSMAQKPELSHDVNSGSLKEQTRRHLEYVRSREPSWEEDLVRLAAAAIHVYRTRFTDIFVRDLVGLLWIIEGNRYIRAHRGVCYLYHTDGAFEAFTGVPPESTFFRLKKFLLVLEGMFRLMDSVERSDLAVLNEVSRLVGEFNHVREFSAACEEEAVTADFTRRRAGRPAADAEEQPKRGWPGRVADMLSRILSPLQKDLLEERRLEQYVFVRASEDMY